VSLLKPSSCRLACTAQAPKCMHITLWCTEQHGMPTPAPSTVFIKITLAPLCGLMENENRIYINFERGKRGGISKLCCMHEPVICSILSSVWVCVSCGEGQVTEGRVIHISYVHKSGGGIDAVVVAVEMIQFPLQIGSHRKRFCLSFSFQFQFQHSLQGLGSWLAGVSCTSLLRAPLRTRMEMVHRNVVTKRKSVAEIIKQK
jgi:hypothetical protein